MIRTYGTKQEEESMMQERSVKYDAPYERSYQAPVLKFALTSAAKYNRSIRVIDLIMQCGYWRTD